MDNQNLVNQISMDGFDELDSYDFAKVEKNLVLDHACAEITLPMENSVSEKVDTISKGMVVDGYIISNSDVVIKGRLNGNISATKNAVSVEGLLVGDIDAEHVNFKDAKVQGNTKAVSTLTAVGKSIIVGDITAQDVSIDSKVKGKIVAINCVEFKKSSLIVGDVITGAIHMEEGSRVNANISITNTAADGLNDDEFKIVS